LSSTAASDRPGSDQDELQVDAKRWVGAGGERALVLGGGGSAGNAWLIGVIAGLFDAGLDVTEADLIIGTSAGSTAAVQITGASPTRLLADILFAAPQQRTGPVGSDGGRVRIGPVADHMRRTSEIIAAAEDAADMRRRLGARRQHCQWLRYPSLWIGDSRYIDGGYRRSSENADLAAGYRRVLVLSPLGGRSGAPLEWGMHLAAQVGELRSRGSRVETILPDSSSRDAFGSNLMDLSTRPPAARAGYDQGRALGEQLTEFWR
jgi:NTE family protein